VEVGDLPNHVKYCVSVLSLLWAMIMNTTVPHGEQKSPKIGIRAPFVRKTEVFLGDIRIFKVVINKFWSFHRVDLIHTNSLPQKSAQSDTGVSHTRLLKIRWL
jgi:hypothetical protein